MYANLYTTSALTTMLPWQVAQVEEVRRDMGDDWWPYGLGKRIVTCSIRFCATTTNRLCQTSTATGRTVRAGNALNPSRSE